MYRISKVKVQRIMLDRWGTVEQKELAARVGLTEATVSRLLSGAGFTAETLSKFCVALSCTPNDILAMEQLPPEVKESNGKMPKRPKVTAPALTI